MSGRRAAIWSLTLLTGQHIWSRFKACSDNNNEPLFGTMFLVEEIAAGPPHRLAIGVGCTARVARTSAHNRDKRGYPPHRWELLRSDRHSLEISRVGCNY